MVAIKWSLESSSRIIFISLQLFNSSHRRRSLFILKLVKNSSKPVPLTLKNLYNLLYSIGMWSLLALLWYSWIQAVVTLNLVSHNTKCGWIRTRCLKACYFNAEYSFFSQNSWFLLLKCVVGYEELHFLSATLVQNTFLEWAGALSSWFVFHQTLSTNMLSQIEKCDR